MYNLLTEVLPEIGGATAFPELQLEPEVNDEPFEEDSIMRGIVEDTLAFHNYEYDRIAFTCPYTRYIGIYNIESHALDAQQLSVPFYRNVTTVTTPVLQNGKSRIFIFAGENASFDLDGKVWEVILGEDKNATIVEQWQMPSPKTGFAVCCDLNYIYIVGGENSYDGVLSSCEKLRMRKQGGLELEKSSLPDLNRGRSYGSVITIN